MKIHKCRKITKAATPSNKGRKKTKLFLKGKVEKSDKRKESIKEEVGKTSVGNANTTDDNCSAVDDGDIDNNGENDEFVVEISAKNSDITIIDDRKDDVS